MSGDSHSGLSVMILWRLTLQIRSPYHAQLHFRINGFCLVNNKNVNNRTSKQIWGQMRREKGINYVVKSRCNKMAWKLFTASWTSSGHLVFLLTTSSEFSIEFVPFYQKHNILFIHLFIWERAHGLSALNNILLKGLQMQPNRTTLLWRVRRRTFKSFLL